MAMFNLQTNVQVISFVAVVSLALLVISNAVSVAAQWLLLTFSMDIGSSVQGGVCLQALSRAIIYFISPMIIPPLFLKYLKIPCDFVYGIAAYFAAVFQRLCGGDHFGWHSCP